MQRRLETLSLEALLTMKKRQNTKKADGGYEEHYLLHAVRKIQAQGIEVAAGFILGADGDTEASFDAHIEFIQTAGVVMAMEGLLTVLKETGSIGGWRKKEDYYTNRRGIMSVRR